MSNVEIEDVLASIRRLVSEADRRAPAPEPAAPDRLVLTPAQRVVEAPVDGPAQQPFAEADDPSADGALAARDDRSGAGAEAEPAPLSLEQTVAELEAAVARQIEEWEPDGSELVAAARAAAETAPPAPGMVELEAADTAVQSETGPQDAAGTVETPVEEVAAEAAQPVEAEAPAEAEPTQQVEPAEPEVAEFRRDSSVTRVHFRRTPVPADPQPGAAPAERPPRYGQDAVADVVFASLSRRIGAEAPPPEDVPPGMPELPVEADAPAAGQAPLAETPAEDLPAAALLADGADAGLEPPPWQAPGADDAATGLPAEEPPDAEGHAGMAEVAAAEPAPQPIAAAADLAAIDEEALRALILAVLREELQGPLGERITRNVRKLVRREIAQALAGFESD